MHVVDTGLQIKLQQDTKGGNSGSYLLPMYCVSSEWTAIEAATYSAPPYDAWFELMLSPCSLSESQVTHATAPPCNTAAFPSKVELLAIVMEE